MVKYAKYTFLLLSLVILYNCSNDFNLIDDFKNIPIVYGVLSGTEEINYIRVERAFVDESTSAFDIAQIPDSLYYENITVTLQNENTGQEINLERIDVSDLGIEREPGVFATDPNILYRFREDDFPLVEDQIINLTITDGNTEQIITQATTPIVGAYEISEIAPPNPLQFKYDSQFTITWRSDELNAQFYDVFMIIHYEEQNPNDPSQWTEKELFWVLDQKIERPFSSGQPSPRVSFNMNGRRFYEFLAQNIDDSITTLRVLTTIDIIVDAGGEELFNFVNVGSANTGITSNQIINTYTNLTEGLGIFSSKSRAQRFEYNLNQTSRDSLRDGIITRHLNFQ